MNTRLESVQQFFRRPLFKRLERDDGRPNRNLQLRTFAGVDVLWRQALPHDPRWNAAEVAIAAKLAVRPDQFLIALDQAKMVCSRMFGSTALCARFA